MTRRGFLMPALAGLVAGCSPLSALNALGPRDGGARRVARCLTYGPEDRQRCDLYAPTGGTNLPVGVCVSGGGWDSGDSTSCDTGDSGGSNDGGGGGCD